MRKKIWKEYRDYDGLQMSFIATISHHKSVWKLPPPEAVDWYIEHVEKQGRYGTSESAEMYREALENEFDKWVEKNVFRKSPAVKRAIVFLESKGYTVTRK